MTPLHELSLFSGGGGFSLGLKLAGLEVRTVAYVEIEPYCQEIIKARIKDGCLDDAPIFPDICAFDGEDCRGMVDIITAGFPCQPHSSAGRRRGKDDERNLWPDTLRIIREVGPRFVLLENVRGLADGTEPYAAEVVGQLSEAGYDARWGLVPAAAVGAPHLRWRWWCLAYPTDNGLGTRGRATEQECQYEEVGGSEQPGPDGQARPVAHSQQPGSQGLRNECRLRESGAEVEGNWGSECTLVAVAQERSARIVHGSPRGQGQSTLGGARSAGGGLNDWWSAEPDVGRVADGVASRVDRLKAIGNGIVPAVVGEFLRLIE